MDVLYRWMIAAVLVAATLPGTGCRGPSDRAPADEPEASSEPLYFEPIGTGHRARMADSVATEVAIRDAGTWAAYRDSLSPLAAFREVDFSQAMVLLAAVPQTTSGHSIEFTSVEQTDTAVVATYVLYAPGSDCLTSAAATMPFSAVLARRAEGPVRFIRKHDTYPCTERRGR